MAKFTIKVEWSQYMRVDKTIEADSFEEAKAIALGIDPNEVDMKDVTYGEVTDDVVAFVNEEEVGVNGMPWKEEGEE